MIKKSKMYYAKKSTPEERRIGKFTDKANIQSTDSWEEKTPIERGDPSGEKEKEKPAKPSHS